MFGLHQKADTELGDIFIALQLSALVHEVFLILEEVGLELIRLHVVDPALAALREHLADVAALVRPDVVGVRVSLLAGAADEGLVELGHLVALPQDLA